MDTIPKTRHELHCLWDNFDQYTILGEFQNLTELGWFVKEEGIPVQELHIKSIIEHEDGTVDEAWGALEYYRGYIPVLDKER